MSRRRPNYTLSRRAFWLSFWFAWLLIGAITTAALRGEAQAVALAPTVVPSMVLLIAAVLGIHRFAGSLDFSKQAAAAAPEGEND